MENSVKPWERQIGETERAFAAFARYRDTPPKDRSIDKCVAAEYGARSMPKVAQWKKWSRDWRWQFRIAAWTDEQDRLAREAQLAEIKAMNRRHIQMALSLQSKGAEKLQKLTADDLTPADMLRLLTEAVKLERIARGEPETIVQHGVRKHPHDFTDDELAAIAAGGGFVAATAKEG